MKLSIIICVYNTPKDYLTECLESITSSTVKTLGEDYEICMVDDGSSEDYSDLAERFDVRVKKTENKGIFSARRTGALMVQGEYCIYCDSDDTVSFNYYLPMLLKAESSGADIVINGWATHTVRARYFAKKDDTISSNMDIPENEALFAFVKNEGRQHSFYVLWNKLYKTKLLLSAFNSLLSSGFNEKSSYSEDAALNFFLWRDAKRVVNIHTGFYFYRIHSGQTVNVISEYKLKQQIDSMADTLTIMRCSIGDNLRKKEITEAINAWEALISRAHFSLAKSGGYVTLYPYIKEKYHISKLKLSTLKDGSAYEHKQLLGDNFIDVDKALIEIYDSAEPVRVVYNKRDKYTAKSVKYLALHGKITDNKNAREIVIPRFEISFKKKLLHNVFLYRIGLILFKKGSKTRNFLKKFL